MAVFERNFSLDQNTSAIKQTIDISHIEKLYTACESDVVNSLKQQLCLSAKQRKSISLKAQELIEASRNANINGTIFDQFLKEYGLSTHEGIVLMRLVEALVRTPDAFNARALIRDKLLSGEWKHHSGNSNSNLVNLATLGLCVSKEWIKITGGMEGSNIAARLGDQVLLSAMKHAMKIMSNHFVLGNSINDAIKKSKNFLKKGSTFSYDMLGEAALTQADADNYYTAYVDAANFIGKSWQTNHAPASAPNLSVKLSAIHPRYESTQQETCIPELTERVIKLAQIAKKYGFGITIDAEEVDRLEISLSIVSRILKCPQLSGWNKLSIVVQAYQKRAPATIDWLAQEAANSNQKLAIRLVKGAYWDMEVKRAQELGLPNYPVFTRKENTDLSYIVCAEKLFAAKDWIFPQFATHNAHTAASIVELAGGSTRYEFQRLHGMGRELHDVLSENTGIQSRIYAPVGKHKDLLPYLVRRLLENGANSSFVNKLNDPDTPSADLAKDPLETIESNAQHQNSKIPLPRDHLKNNRKLAKGWDFTQLREGKKLEASTDGLPYDETFSIIGGKDIPAANRAIFDPSNSRIQISTAHFGNETTVHSAISVSQNKNWANSISPEQRQAILLKAANLLEEEAALYFSLCVNEAGKPLPDAIDEVREAVDFCRFYAMESATAHIRNRKPLGTVLCISPWNFPLAIFLGQITAALAAGNNVIAKPAETTPTIAYAAVRLLHRAGVPQEALQLVIGDGETVGNALVSSDGIHGICFTGSTQTAKAITSTLADTHRAETPLIAETGGMNAMIVDSTALLEQSVSDTVDSAFQSAGQRCSACRIVFVQETIAKEFEEMLAGAMKLLKLGQPSKLSTDIGPVINAHARDILDAYKQKSREKWEVIHETPKHPQYHKGYYVSPIAFRISSISELSEEKFGPILHVVHYKAEDLPDVVQQINALGYGLTLGAHSRIDYQIQKIQQLAKVGNLYVNRNQIGAIVGVQPFGGEGLSGTGPKAGGPHYVKRLSRPLGFPETSKDQIELKVISSSKATEATISKTRLALQNWNVSRACETVLKLEKYGFDNVFVLQGHLPKWIDNLPGPTGETNTLRLLPRGVLVSKADSYTATEQQILKAIISGNAVIAAIDTADQKKLIQLKSKLVENGLIEDLLVIVPNEGFTDYLASKIDGAIVDGTMRSSTADYLCRKEGPILPLLSGRDDIERFCIERTTTTNTTAAGGNASLLSL